MILIVDDKKENIISLKSFLEVNNFPVDTASSGEEALKKILQHAYALIILDVQMPGMDGFEVAEAISGYSKVKDIPIIFLSAVNTDKKFITKGYSSGGIDYVTKPFDPDLLLLKVKTFYRLYEQNRELNEIQQNLRREISEKVKAEDLLAEKVEELHSTLESIPQIAFTADQDGKIDFVNEQWFSYSSAKNRFPEVHPDDISLEKIWNETVHSGQSAQQEVFIKKIDTSEFRYHLLTIKPVKREQQVIKWVGTFTDIHHQRVINELLEQRVAERTQELVKINQELEASNNDLQQFASVASHDLKEPLRKIQVFSTIIRDKYLKEDGNNGMMNYMNRIINSSERMSGLISDLLSFSRLSVNSLFYMTDINKLIEEILVDLELSVSEKKAKVTISEIPPMEVISGQIRQVFQNLLSNALKFSRKNVPPEINILAERIAYKDVQAPVDEEGEWCRILVSDNGIGFEEQYLNKIFTIFQRLNPKEVYEGTGIGLAIAKKIIDKHNGLITAVSTPGKGSTFIMVLPIKQTLTISPGLAGIA